jgi:hypothetical protein
MLPARDNAAPNCQFPDLPWTSQYSLYKECAKSCELSQYDLMSPKRPDWSRPLPQPTVIPYLMALQTLADVRVLLGHLPKEYRAKETWRHVANTLDEAAGGGIEPVEVTVSLKLVLSMEGIPCAPQ